MLAAAQREIIDLHVAVVQKAKLTPRAIDVEPLALARTMQLELRAQNPIIDYDDVTAVLNIGQTGTEISILRGDIVVFTRSVPNGGGNLTRAIAETMGIPPSDAERLKIERGDALPPAGYGQDEAQDDFGFGGFDEGGGNTVDFGGGGFDDDFGADSVTGTATATGAPATATAGDAAAARTIRSIWTSSIKGRSRRSRAPVTARKRTTKTTNRAASASRSTAWTTIWRPRTRDKARTT